MKFKEYLMGRYPEQFSDFLLEKGFNQAIDLCHAALLSHYESGELRESIRDILHEHGIAVVRGDYKRDKEYADKILTLLKNELVTTQKEGGDFEEGD